jgi:hypothetical protein
VVLAAMNVLLALFLVYQFFNPVLLRVEDKKYLDSLADRQGGAISAKKASPE